MNYPITNNPNKRKYWKVLDPIFFREKDIGSNTYITFKRAITNDVSLCIFNIRT